MASIATTPPRQQPQPPSDEPASACDKYAASEFDTQRRLHGVPFDEIDPSLAVPECESAARQFPDNTRVVFQLGRAYQKASNFVSASAQYRKAAERNFALVQASLGFMYQSGQGVTKDYQEAVARYRKTAEQDLGIAQNNLGIMYQMVGAWLKTIGKLSPGIGKPLNKISVWPNSTLVLCMSVVWVSHKIISKLIAWYQKGADQGQKEAKGRLDEVKAKIGVLPGVNNPVPSNPTLEQTAAYTNPHIE
jgi:TPR repeat protein